MWKCMEDLKNHRSIGENRNRNYMSTNKRRGLDIFCSVDLLSLKKYCKIWRPDRPSKGKYNISFRQELKGKKETQEEH